MYEESIKKEYSKKTDSTRIDLCGLWKNEGKNFFSGKIPEDIIDPETGESNGEIILKGGEYITMFENSNQNPSAPVWNLVVYRKKYEG